MHVHVVLAHPEANSFNAHLANVARDTLEGQGASVTVSDLYSMNFDPCERAAHYSSPQDQSRFDVQSEQRHASAVGTVPAEVAEEIARLEQADLLILQYPMWWHLPPAMLKGWLDRVFVYGRAYTSRMRYDAGKFRGRRAMLSVTVGGPQATFLYNGRNGDIDHLLWPLNFTLHYLGFTVLEPFVAFGVEGGLKYSEESVAAARLRGYLTDYGKALEDVAGRPALPFNGWDDWDGEGRLKPGVPGYSPFMRAEP